jgi:hypothetical protein
MFSTVQGVLTLVRALTIAADPSDLADALVAGYG